MSAPLRLGIVGTGYIAGVVASALRLTDRVVLTGVASRDAERARAFADASGGGSEVASTADWRTLVDAREVDALYLATPTVPRTEVAIAAAEAGMHLLVEKPYADSASLAAITDACRARGVAFLDATHFVHHPRHELLRATLHERIGDLLALNASFTFPSMDHANVRHDPSREPTGAWGDMAWYAMRALVEFTTDESRLADASAFAVRDAQSQSIVRSSGALRLDTGVTATWDVAYDIGTCLQDLHLMGSEGRIRLDDFVLDWASGFAIPLAGSTPSFAQQRGLTNPAGVVTERVPNERPQVVRMLERFAELCAEPNDEGVAASIRATLRTQRLLDEVWSHHHIA